MIRSCALVALALATPALATPTFYPSLGGSSLLQPDDDTRVEARFRADTTNWDTRLEFDSFPNNGDTTGAVGNNRSFFENQSFGFDLSYTLATSTVAWTITRPNNTTSTLTQVVSGFDQLNTIQLFTVGTRGSVTLTNLAFTGLGMDTNAFPTIDARPAAEGGPTFAETFMFFGNAFDLLAGDWSLSGSLAFGGFTHNNPSENSKITIKLRDTTLVPTPASAALLGLGTLVATRRRR